MQNKTLPADVGKEIFLDFPLEPIRPTEKTEKEPRRIPNRRPLIWGHITCMISSNWTGR